MSEYVDMGAESSELLYFSPTARDRKDYVKRILDRFTEHLASNGLRLTGQRRRILEYFLQSNRHLSQEDIYGALRKHGIGRATVFRTLKMLEECGIVNHVVGTKGTPRFEVEIDRPHHDHLICVECGRIQEVRWPELEEIQERACKKLGFEVKWHRHEIFGRCRECAGDKV